MDIVSTIDAAIRYQFLQKNGGAEYQCVKLVPSQLHCQDQWIGIHNLCPVIYTEDLGELH